MILLSLRLLFLRNLTPDLFVARLKVDREFRHIDEPDIIKDLFRSNYLKTIDGFPVADIWANKNFNTEELKVLPLQCQATNMSFLEPLFREGIKQTFILLFLIYL